MATQSGYEVLLIRKENRRLVTLPQTLANSGLNPIRVAFLNVTSDPSFRLI